MVEQKELFKGHDIEVVDTKPIVRRAEYEAVLAKKPQFGMDKRELFVLHRAGTKQLANKRRAAWAGEQDKELNKAMGG